MFDSKFTFERHIRSTSSSVAQKIGLLGKSFRIFGMEYVSWTKGPALGPVRSFSANRRREKRMRRKHPTKLIEEAACCLLSPLTILRGFRIFGDHDVLLKCFNSYILPCLEYCSSAADSHLRLLDRNLRACKFLIPNLTISLQHRRFISSLCMLYKIFHNPSHPLHSELSNLLRPMRVTRGSLSINSLSFALMRFQTSQYSRCFIPATTKLWNELPSMIVEATKLQKFKLGAKAFLLGVDGL